VEEEVFFFIVVPVVFQVGAVNYVDCFLPFQAVLEVDVAAMALPAAVFPREGFIAVEVYENFLSPDGMNPVGQRRIHSLNPGKHLIPDAPLKKGAVGGGGGYVGG